jgi:hypothetical protein
MLLPSGARNRRILARRPVRAGLFMTSCRKPTVFHGESWLKEFALGEVRRSSARHARRDVRSQSSSRTTTDVDQQAAFCRCALLWNGNSWLGN